MDLFWFGSAELSIIYAIITSQDRQKASVVEYGSRHWPSVVDRRFERSDSRVRNKSISRLETNYAAVS